MSPHSIASAHFLRAGLAMLCTLEFLAAFLVGAGFDGVSHALSTCHDVWCKSNPRNAEAIVATRGAHATCASYSDLHAVLTTGELR